MKNLLVYSPVVVMTLGALAFMGAGIYGMVISEVRSKQRDKQLAEQSAELHKKALESMEASRKDERERHEAVMASLQKDLRHRKSPWEE